MVILEAGLENGNSEKGGLFKARCQVAKGLSSEFAVMSFVPTPRMAVDLRATTLGSMLVARIARS